MFLLWELTIKEFSYYVQCIKYCIYSYWYRSLLDSSQLVFLNLDCAHQGSSRLCINASLLLYN